MNEDNFWEQDFWQEEPEELTEEDVIIQEEKQSDVDEDDEEWFLDLQQPEDESEYERSSALKEDRYLSTWVPAAPARKTSELARYAYQYLNNKGIPAHVSAGIVGNLMKESNLNPTTRDGDKRGGIGGIAQWDPSRSQALYQYARKSGKDVSSLDTQLDFVYHEASQRGDLQKAMQTSTPEEAAVVFGRSYERPNEKYADWESRKSYARSVGQMQYGGDIPELEGVSNEAIQQYLEEENAPEFEESTTGGIVPQLINAGVGAVKKVNEVRNYFGQRAAQYTSDLIDIASETAGIQKNNLSLRKYNEQKSRKNYRLARSVNNTSPIYT